MTRLRLRVRGLVQGVGYRPFVHQQAIARALTGWVLNDEQGVLLEAQGPGVEALARALRDEAPPLARVDAVEVEPLAPVKGEVDFHIVASQRGGSATVAIGPDAGTCLACFEEVCTPGARRYRYPFTTCTHCGPRYAITRGLPYDRPNTSMASFPLCAACRAEYEDPSDRRFHAQPLACPACGPSLSLPLEDVVAHLRRGAIVALKGLGGFQLLCDARNEEAVARLRRNKQRDGKPFAVMVASLAAAHRLVSLSPDEVALLESWHRPIVLARRRHGEGPGMAAALAPSIAPGLRSLGVLLPTTPLHLLLFHEAQGRPAGLGWLQDEALDFCLVCTSANPGGEPLVIDDAEAARRLAGIAEVVVTHGREVVVRVDDSVARVVAGGPTLLRRARGYVPWPVKLHGAVPCVLALGPHQKVTACLTRGDEAYVSQHVGDLDDAATFGFLEETVRHLTATLEVAPVAVACDLHPDFLSTRLAEATGLPVTRVQHHHAHLAAVLAEHRRLAPTVGLALDGFGLGSDGGAWGGELLRLEGATFRRLGHLEPLAQPGGDAAAQAPWRMAAAALHRLGRGGEIGPRFSPLAGGLAAGVAQLLERGVHAPFTSSCGRLFDAACGLLGVRPVSTFEGEAPMVLESLVTVPEVLADGWTVREGRLDFLPLLGALADLRGDTSEVAMRGANLFHGTLTAALIDWALPHLEEGVVALGGGCLQNQVLAQGLVEGFARRGVTALLPRQVPANDGGLSLGQAWVAVRALADRKDI